MVKQAKKKEQPKGEDKQTKISSFFDNKTETKKESKLFTNVGTAAQKTGKLTLMKRKGSDTSSTKTDLQNKTDEKKSAFNLRTGPKQDKENDDNDVVFIDVDDEDCPHGNSVSSVSCTSDKGSKVITTDKNHSCEKKNLGLQQKLSEKDGILTSTSYAQGQSNVETILTKETGGIDDKETKNYTLLHNKNEEESKKTVNKSYTLTEKFEKVEPQDSDSAECSSFLTPEKKSQESVVSTVGENSPDIICETPEANAMSRHRRERQKKVFASRSFLRPVDLLSVQPGLKPNHLRANAQKRAKKAAVHISFNVRPDPDVNSVVKQHVPKPDDIMGQKNAFPMFGDQSLETASKEKGVLHACHEEERKHTGSNILQSCGVGLVAEHAHSKDAIVHHTETGTITKDNFTIPETQDLWPDRYGNTTTQKTESDVLFSNYENNIERSNSCLKEIDNFSIQLDGTAKTCIKDMDTNSSEFDPSKKAVTKSKLSSCEDRAKTDIDVDQTSSLGAKLRLFQKTKSDSYRSCEFQPLAKTKSKSKLINALEEVDVRAEEAEENTWMGERLIKNFAERDSQGGISKVKVTDEKEETTNISDTTPVKIHYGSKMTIKRQAKSGLSPLSKRLPHQTFSSSSDFASGNSIATDGFEPVSLEPSLLSAKKSLNMEFTGAAKKSSKFTRQQALAFGLKEKNQKDDAMKNVTLEDDAVLADLLGGFNCTPQKSVKVSKETVTAPGQNSLKKLLIGKSNRASHVRENKNLSSETVLPSDMELLNQLFGPDISDSDHDDTEERDMKKKRSEIPFVHYKPQNIAVSTETENVICDGEDPEDCIVILDSSSIENKDLCNNEDDECIVIDDNTEDDRETKNVQNILLQRDNVETVNKQNQSSLKDSEDKVEERNPTVSKESFNVLDSNINTTTKVNNIKESFAASEKNPSDHFSDVINNELIKRNRSSNANATGSLSTDKVDSTPLNELNISSFATMPDYLSNSISEMLSESFGEEEGNLVLHQPQGSCAGPKPVSDFCFTDLWNRFIVTNVSHDQTKDEIHLSLLSDKTNQECHCVLKGFWADTNVNEDDVVNIEGEFTNGVCVIDDRKGLLVVNPDRLLSGTLVVSSVFCARKSVLNEKFKGIDAGNLSMLYGSIIHSLFQSVLKEHLMEKGAIMQQAKALLQSNKFLHEMYSHNIQEDKVLEEICNYIPSLVSWMEKHTDGSTKSRRSDVLVKEICDIEENIWCPRLGVKGKIDMTIKAELKKSNRPDTVKILPLELKTGKASFSSEHKGQVTLYSMMLADRLKNPEAGILLYLKEGQMEVIDVKPESKSGLIQLRNLLAHYLTRTVSQETSADGHVTYNLGQLPKPINSERACSKCAHLLSCSIYQRSVEQTQLPKNHAMTTLVPESVQHLSDIDQNYFMHWVLCLDLEERESSNQGLRQIWCSSSDEREKKGDCLSNMIIVNSELGIQESQCFSEGKGCSLTFTKHQSYSGTPVSAVGLNCNDMVVISSEDGRYIALATGFIIRISSDSVEVVVDRDYLHDTDIYNNLQFRLDRNQSFTTSSYLYTNLAKLMEPQPRASQLRDLIIKQRKPQFDLKLSKACIQKVKTVFKPLNKPQRAAILKVLMSKDYVLIRGFPGTGKTSTIVALVKILTLLGQSVLLTSYTHSAVDNILLKLKQDGIPFLRLGRKGRIHPAILPHCAEILTSSPDINSVHKLKQFYHSYDIVATSCLGVNHPLFSQRKFDVCIVDEASQVVQPACLGPLFYSNKFILVGDPKQLPPLVLSKEAKHLGMTESLFARLEDAGATYDLDLQYRMNRVVMGLSNKFVYNGQLQCGNQNVADQCISLNYSKLQDSPQWMQQALSPELEKSVMFLDTQMTQAVEKSDGKGLTNEIEGELALSILQALVKANVMAEDIGIISPYRSQVLLIRQKVQNSPMVARVEVNTIDQYQGRDKSIIIVSFARSQSEHVGELLKDIHRLNVALTRAKHKLILLGNAKVLRSYEHLANILQWLEESQNKSKIIQVTA